MGAVQPHRTGLHLKLRRFFIFVHDVGAAALAWMVAFFFRFNFEMTPPLVDLMLTYVPYTVLVHAAVFSGLGLYRGMWRHSSLSDLKRILIAVGLAAAIVPAILGMLRIDEFVPRSVYFMAPLLLASVMCGSRLAYRAWREGMLLPVLVKPQANPVLVLGAGSTAAALIRDLALHSQWRIVGLLDDDPAKQGAELAGMKVLGRIDQVAEIAERHGMTEVIMAMPEATHGERKRAVELCTRAGITVMTVPALSDIVSGKVSISALRAIELDDLLGRDPVQLDDAGLHRFLTGRTVLITGAGGSIGGELCRQIARFAPARIVLYELSEFALYAIEQNLHDRFPHIELAAVIGDAKDEARIADILRRHRPQVVDGNCVRLGRGTGRLARGRRLESVGARLFAGGLEVVEDALDTGQPLDHVLLQGHGASFPANIAAGDLRARGSLNNGAGVNVIYHQL